MSDSHSRTRRIVIAALFWAWFVLLFVNTKAAGIIALAVIGLFILLSLIAATLAFVSGTLGEF